MLVMKRHLPLQLRATGHRYGCAAQVTSQRGPAPPGASRLVCLLLAHRLEPADRVVKIALEHGEALQQRLHAGMQQRPRLLVVRPRLGRPVAHAERVEVAAASMGWGPAERGRGRVEHGAQSSCLAGPSSLVETCPPAHAIKPTAP